MSFPFSPSNRQTPFVVFLIEFLGVDIAKNTRSMAVLLFFYAEMFLDNIGNEEEK
jgi:hypothetical protein